MKKLSLLLFLLFASLSVMVAQRTVSGTVSDSEGVPLIGANVLVKGTTVGTITDIDGSFALSVPDDATALEISYTGYKTQELALTGDSNYSVTLSEGTVLSEAVIVGYGERSEINNVQAVSTLNSEDIESIVAVSPQQALQGQISGVQMTNSSGVLGAASSIRVRGVSSITGGTQPLYVIDGVPLNTGDSYSSAYGGASTLNPLLDLSTDDIESFTVLKDASAVAIYGSRGANGVILINTKRGKAGNSKIGVNLSTGWLTPTNTYEMTNSAQYAELRGTEPSDVDFDWVDAVRQTGRTYNAGVNFSGGSDRTTYFASGNYLDQSNYSIGNDLSRLSGRLNFQHAATDKLRFGANVSLSKALMDRTSVENSTFAPFTSAYLQAPFVDAFNEDGSYANTGFIANVIAIEELGLVEYTQRRTVGNFFVKYDLIDNLTLETQWGIDNVQSEEEFREVEAITPGGYAYKEINTDFKWLTTNSLSYSTDVGEKSILRVKLAQVFETSQLNSVAVEASGFAADALRNVSSGSTPTTTASLRTEWALASYFATANYNIDNKYTVEGAFRRDGSSRFGENNRWGNFWSLGANWIISNEDFMADNDFFDFLKLRASYGTTGNDQIGNFPSRGLFNAGVDSDYNGNAGLRPTQPANPDLKWEETAQFDIGFETRFLDRFSLDVSYYQKNTTDLLLPFQVAGASGFTSVVRNAGEMNNTGVDLDFGAEIIDNEDFRWTANLNLGWLNNEIISLPDAAVDPDGRRFIAGSANQRAIEGQSLNEFYLIRYAGVNPETGDAEWLTADGERTTTPSSSDRVQNGSAIPSLTGGLNTSIQYKNFDLRALFTFVTGSKVYIGDLRFAENAASGFNTTTDLLDYWRNPGDNSFAPSPNSPTWNSFAQRSTLQLFDGDFGRLKNLELGYTLRGKNVGLEGLGSARLYVRGNNLLTFVSSEFRGQDIEVSADGTDPLIQGESFFAMPQARIIQVGLNANF